MADKLVIPFRGEGRVSSTNTTVYDSFGHATALKIGTNEVDVTALKINGTTLNAAAAALTAAEIQFLDGATAGTQVASKAVIADSNINTGVSKVTALHIGASGSETEVTSSAAELNILDGVLATATEINHATDDSANTETIDSGVAVSVTKTYTNIDNTTAGAGAITLAAAGATMQGKIKVIEMTVDGGDVTLALTNVQGGTAATTATFSAVGHTLVLLGTGTKWTVLKEFGVVLS